MAEDSDTEWIGSPWDLGEIMDPCGIREVVVEFSNEDAEVFRPRRREEFGSYEILQMAAHLDILLRGRESQSMRTNWLLLFVALAIIGVIVWAVPAFDWEWSKANRFSELGAAVAGGATIAVAVLIVESNLAGRAEKEARKSRELLEQESLRVQATFQEKMNGIDIRKLGKESFKGSYWNKKEVKHAYLAGAQLDDSLLWNCDFSSTYFFGASFVKAKLNGSKFDGTHLGGANLSEAKLINADLSGAYLIKEEDPLTNNKCGGVRLAGADLSDTNVCGADLTGVEDIEEAENLETLIYDAGTRWPHGRKPDRVCETNKKEMKPRPQSLTSPQSRGIGMHTPQKAWMRLHGLQ